MRNICETEEQTGFSRESFSHPPHGKEAIQYKEDDLGHLSANMSSTLASLALYIKHLKLATAITDILANPRDHPVASFNGHDLQSRDIVETSQTLYRSSIMTLEYVAYLQKRAEIQQSVVCPAYYKAL